MSAGAGLPDPPGCNVEVAQRVLTAFLREESHQFGFQRAVLGLSGGVDSAVVLQLGARALGPENLLAVAMPYRSSSPDSLRLARQAAEGAGVELRAVDITPMADAFIAAAGMAEDDSPGARVRKGNLMARTRMVLLYDLSAERSGLVLGTSNKTELMLGYGTLFGDMASALNPIGDLYKSQVILLARHLGVPEGILARPPTADLWAGQTDEEELGFTYAEVDAFLHCWVDRRYPREALERLGFRPAFIDRIQAMVRRNQYKRRPPLIAKLANRTVNLDYRYVRDWGA